MLCLHYRSTCLLVIHVMCMRGVNGVEPGEGDSSRCAPDGVKCENGAVCELHTASDGTRLELCICSRHYSGRLCEHANTVCSRVSCKYGFSCDVDGCMCDAQHSGEDCSQTQCYVGDKLTEHYCKNGGLCHNGVCVCPNHTTGAHCELAVCGDHLCVEGYCMVDRCECDVTCVVGCDATTGKCKTESDSLNSNGVLSSTTRVILLVVVIVVFVVIMPALYAMYNMRIENQLKNERLKSHFEMEKRYQEAYIARSAASAANSTSRRKSTKDESRRKSKDRDRDSRTDDSVKKKRKSEESDGVSRTSKANGESLVKSASDKDGNLPTGLGSTTDQKHRLSDASDKKPTATTVPAATAAATAGPEAGPERTDGGAVTEKRSKKGKSKRKTKDKKKKKKKR